jgi:transposase
LKEEAVRMVLDGHSVASVCQRLGLSSPNLLYNWKRKLVEQGGGTAVGLEARVRELEAELRRVERERDILKKALAIFGRDE